MTDQVGRVGRVGRVGSVGAVGSVQGTMVRVSRHTDHEAGLGHRPRPLRPAVRYLYGSHAWTLSIHAAVDVAVALACVAVLVLVFLPWLAIAAVVAPLIVLRLSPPIHRPWTRLAVRLGNLLARLERSRIRRTLGVDVAEPAASLRGGPLLAYACLRVSVGLLLALLVVVGWGVGIGMVLGSLLHPTGLTTWSLGFTAACLLLTPYLARVGARWDVSTVRGLLAPADSAALNARVQELFESRAGAVEAVDAERRRIERDLHDGVQQRLVALSILLGRAERAADRAPERVAPLLRQAHRESLQSLRDLREVSWRIFPSVLDDRGLDAALSGLAGRSSVPVRVTYGLADRLPPRVESVAYFVASEAVTNAVKHAAAHAITITVAGGDGTATMEVVDDGRGGADMRGSGLSGLARRVAAVDGRLSVDSPVGGPTVVRAELPCAS